MGARPIVIVADGEKPDFAFAHSHLREAHTIIALDGAAHWLLDHGIKPHLIIGDLDSFRGADDPTLVIHPIDDQNSNDLEKAFSYCEQHALNHITVLGGFGLRADHFLTNLYVLSKFASRLNVTFVDTEQIAFICPRETTLHITAQTGSYISLFPLGDQVGPIWTTGLLYPLHGEMLSLQTRIGTLNCVHTEHATLRYEQGALLVLIQRLAQKKCDS